MTAHCMVKGLLAKLCIVPEGSVSYNNRKSQDPEEMSYYVTFQLSLVFTKVNFMVDRN